MFLRAADAHPGPCTGLKVHFSLRQPVTAEPWPIARPKQVVLSSPNKEMPPSKYDKAKQEKNEAFKDLLKALEAQDGELTDRIERMEEKVLNLEARNQKDSQPVVSVFADLARQAAWST